MRLFIILLLRSKFILITLLLQSTSILSQYGVDSSKLDQITKDQLRDFNAKIRSEYDTIIIQYNNNHYDFYNKTTYILGISKESIAEYRLEFRDKGYTGFMNNLRVNKCMIPHKRLILLVSKIRMNNIFSIQSDSMLEYIKDPKSSVFDAVEFILIVMTKNSTHTISSLDISHLNEIYENNHRKRMLEITNALIATANYRKCKRIKL